MRERILITGCSSGIGRAAAIQLVGAGHTVIATARQPDSLIELAELGCTTLALDVTDSASMTAALEQAGTIDILINNAGYGAYGPIEQVPVDDVRRQFETNVFGLIELTQLVLPGLRDRRHGRIINVSSMGGRTTLPGGGIYHASKYAVEAISDALRLELHSFGVQVVLIEPGIVRTAWSDTALDHQSGTSSADDDPYADYKNGVATSMAQAYEGPMARLSISADRVAEVIVKAVEARHPRPRYLISPAARSLVTLKTVLPDRVHDAVLRRQYRLP